MDDPLPFASETIVRLKANGHDVHYLTNNSSKSRADYVEKLSRFDIEATVEEIMTSAFAAGRLFQQREAIGKSVYVVGESGLKNELASVGMSVVEFEECPTVDYVVVGWDRSFTYKKLTSAHLAIENGAKFIATNRDATYPDANNKTLPGSGAIVAAVATCTGVDPFVIGKPETFCLNLILESSDYTASDTIVIGDRLDTDIYCGNAAGARTVLTLTGVSSRSEAEAAQGHLKPDVIIDDLSQLQ